MFWQLGLNAGLLLKLLVRFICKKLFINLNKRYAYYNPHVVVVRKLEKKGNHALKHFYIFLKKTAIYYQCNVTKKYFNVGRFLRHSFWRK